MTSPELENLVRTGQLKHEPPSAREQAGLRASALARLADAANESLSFDGRFDLAYNAAHAFALFALRRLGYRSDHRYLVFQLLPKTAGSPPEVWRVLSAAHDRRNLAEYEGHLDRDDRLLADVLIAAERLRVAVEGLEELDS